MDARKRTFVEIHSNPKTRPIRCLFCLQPSGYSSVLDDDARRHERPFLHEELPSWVAAAIETTERLETPEEYQSLEDCPSPRFLIVLRGEI